MSKYNEVMDHIRVDGDMRLRVLSNVERQLAGEEVPPAPAAEPAEEKKENRIVRPARWKKLIPIGAAACLLLAAGTVLRQAGLFTMKGDSSGAAPAAVQSAASADGEAAEELQEFPAEYEEAAETAEADPEPETEDTGSGSSFSMDAAEEEAAAEEEGPADAEDNKTAEKEETAEEESLAVPEDDGSVQASESLYDSASMQVCGSLEELRAEAAFPVRYPGYLPYEMGTCRSEYLKDGEAAVIGLYGENGMTIAFRTAPAGNEEEGDGEASGEVIPISAEETEREGVSDLTLSGEADRWYLAEWTEEADGQVLSCSASCDRGLSKDEFIRIVNGME